MTTAPSPSMPLLEPVEEISADQESVMVQAGKGMAFWVALIFLGLYLIRPQDWVPGMSGVNVIRPIILLWMGALLVQGTRSPLSGWLRTPHDWAILGFWIYVVWNAPAGTGAAMGMFSLAVFYFLTSQSLTDGNGILAYLKYWNVCLLVTAALGVAQVLGWDITNGQGTTDRFFGRLAIGTWLADNPNALGHTIMPALPLSYLFFFWRGSLLGRMFVFPLCAGLIGWCAWETQSKGSFLVGAGLCVLLFLLGKPKWVQAIIVIIVLSVGVGALSFLPRMQDMGNLRADEGVQGRLMAWEMALTAMDQNLTGAGWKQFVALIDWRDGNQMFYGIRKATHSSYVQVGADLGRPGLFLWLLALWTAVRSTLFFKSRSDDEERCRRAALLLTVAYLASGWMINRQYHTEYFLVIAVAASLHRLAAARVLGEPVATPVELDAASGTTMPPGMILHAAPDSLKRRSWTRLTWLDVSMGYGLMLAVVWVWQYILANL